MYSVRLPSGEFLDTPPNLQISYELNNQVFTGSRTDALPGSFTFPFDLPLTGRLRRQLDWPDVITNARPWTSIPECWIYVHNTPLFYGTLSVQQAGPGKVRVSIVSKPVGVLKETPISELDLGGDRALPGGASDWIDAAKIIAADPDNYDFVFTPVRNPTENAGVYYWNYWDVPLQDFIAASSRAISPFIKVKYLLQQMFAFATNDYVFYNEFQSNKELERLCVFNNADIRTSNGSTTPALPTTINLSNHVPEGMCADFVKRLMATFNLGLFTNIFQRTIRLIPLKTILARSPKWNWTPYAANDYTIEAPADPPGHFQFDQPYPLPNTLPTPNSLTTFDTYEDYAAALATLAPGYYYVNPYNLLVQVISSSPLRLRAWTAHQGITVDPDGSVFNPGIDAMTMGSAFHYMLGTDATASYYDEVSAGVWEWQEGDSGTSLFFYRGMYEEPGTGYVFPLGSLGVWDNLNPANRIAITDDPATDHGDAQYSLNWAGDYGLYPLWHQQWNDMVREGKTVTRRFKIPLSEIIGFNFEDKVKVENMDYIVVRLRIQEAVTGGYMMVEATMVSVI